MNRYAVVLALAIYLLMPTTLAAAECQFVLGFATLRDLIGHDIVGECLENEHHGANGDALQQTSGGLLVWRKADNWTAFTDGYRTWINGPNGLVQRLNTERFAWEADYAPGGGIATPTPTPVPTPSPESLIRVEQAIAALPLVQRDPGFASGFQRLARVSQPVFWALLEQVGSNEFFRPDDLAAIAEVDESTALQIVRMPFMSTPSQGDDYAVLEYASRLAGLDLAGLQQILSHPKLQGGITDDHITTFVLLVLETWHPETAAAIQALPWIQDGVSRRSLDYLSSIGEDPKVQEEGLVLTLATIAAKSREVSISLLRKPWIHDSITTWEIVVTGHLLDIASQDAAGARQLLAMPFLDSVTSNDAGILFALSSLARSDRRGFREVLIHPALRDGITDDQQNVVESLVLAKRDPTLAAAIQDLPWVQDGLDASEERAFSTMQEVSRGTRQLVPALARKSWVRDGLSKDEIDALWRLAAISRTSGLQDEAAALAILEMPFLDDFDAADNAAVDSLSVLLHSTSTSDESYLRQTLSHPRLGGKITDSNKSLVAVLHAVRKRPELFSVLLDPGQTSVEERTIKLPLAGEVLLAVVHTRRGTFRTMDILDRTVRAQEVFMLEAFPRKFVGLLVADVSDAAGGGGQLGLPFIDPGGENNVSLIAHEVAHTYWSYGASWLREGGAIVLELAAQNLLSGALSRPFRHNCLLADSLSDLERVEREIILSGDTIDEIFPTGICPYDMGWGLFRDLNRGLGDGAFRQGFRSLYLKLKNDEHRDVCYVPRLSVCYMNAAFVTDASPETAAIAEPIINRWYYGSEHGGQ